MSFTAEIKDELSRVEEPPAPETSQLAGMVRTCGTLALLGQQRFRLSLSTETGSVARTLIKLFRSVYDLPCELTVRRSVLHKTRNYLLSVSSEQPTFAPALVEMGILTSSGMLIQEIAPHLIDNDEKACAYLRGVFMAGGFVADPHNDAHFELIAQTVPFAEGLADLLNHSGVNARVSKRRGSFVIYSKNTEDILTFLAMVGAPQSAERFKAVREIKSVRNDTNRLVNAEIANQRKASEASAGQNELIDAAEAEIGLDRLPPALRDFCELRRAHPELSLRELGEEATPALSKSAMYHRVRRLEEMLSEVRSRAT